LLFPRVSSERRKYIPIDFVSKNVIANDQVLTISNATIFHFGILTSEMHMTWVKYMCGRLKSDFRYSKDVVYNNFPWPENSSEKQIEAVEEAAKLVLEVRKAYPGSSLANLYGPLTMPSDLVKAHRELDRAVDRCYRPQPFPDEMRRIEFLFDLYARYTADLFTPEKPKRKRG
jgi:hypothetical protein